MWIHAIVFRSKVLEAHRHHTCASSSDSSASGCDLEEEGVESKGTPLPLAPPPTCLDKPEEEAMAVLKRHQEFLQRERLLASKYYQTRSDLPRRVSSRRGGGESAGGAGEGPAPGGGEPRPQTVKNRKRKLKKKRAREKRFKHAQEPTPHSEEKNSTMTSNND